MIEAVISPMHDSVAVPASFRKARVSVSTYEIDPVCDPRWATFVDSHPQSSVFHSTNWLMALRNVYGYDSVAITTCPPGSSLTNGLVFCRIKSRLTGRRLVSLPFSDHCEPLVDKPDELDAMLTQLKQQVNQGEWKYVEIRPVSYEPNCHTELSRLVTYHFHSLDLRPERSSYFRTFTKTAFRERFVAPNGKSSSTKRVRQGFCFRSSIALL